MACPLPQWQWVVPPAIMPPSTDLAPLPTVPVSCAAACLPLTFSDKDGCYCPSFLLGVLGLKPRASCIPDKFSTTELNHHHPFSWEGLGVETGVALQSGLYLGWRSSLPSLSGVETSVLILRGLHSCLEREMVSLLLRLVSNSCLCGTPLLPEQMGLQEQPSVLCDSATALL